LRLAGKFVASLKMMNTDISITLHIKALTHLLSISIICMDMVSLQCFDAVGWVSGRARKYLTDAVLAWLSPGAKCK